VQKHKIKIEHPSISYFSMKHNLKKGKPEQKFKTNNNLIVSFQFLQGINTKTLARHEIQKKLGGASMVSNHQKKKNLKWVLS